MYRITKEFSFSASHALSGLPDGHQCSRLHGHNYRVELVLEADVLRGPGFVRDYGELEKVGEWIDRYLDHRHLNDFIENWNDSELEMDPTAETLAAIIFTEWTDVFPEMMAVRVSETPRTWAEFRP